MVPSDIVNWKDFLKEYGCRNIVDYEDWVMCNCPFHEQTDVSRPSFGIHKDTGIGNCFGCGGHKWEDICKLFGISSEDFIDGIKEKAWEFFRKKITGEKALSYGTYKRYSLPSFAFCVDNSNYYYSYFYSKNINLDVVKCCRIQYVSSINSKYHECLLFPVMDEKGVLFFHARYIGNLSWKPRWFYPKNCAKWKTYFNWERYKNRESVFFVEGATDAMKLMQFGLPGIAAKEFSPFQLKMIFKSGIKNIFLLYDNDEAGENYTKKALKLLSNSGINLRVCKYDSRYKDPAVIGSSSELFESNSFLNDYIDTFL